MKRFEETAVVNWRCINTVLYRLIEQAIEILTALTVVDYNCSYILSGFTLSLVSTTCWEEPQ